VVKTKNATNGPEPAIIMQVLDQPEMKAGAVFLALSESNSPKTTKKDVRFIRRIVKQVLAEQELRRNA